VSGNPCRKFCALDLSNVIAYSNKSYTFPFENRKNIAVIALSPDSNVLISVDEGLSC
jgi:hypothetical protein